MKECSGIYEIKCVVTGKVYVGSSGKWQGRWRAHVRSLRKGEHSNPYLQAAWSKYGEDKFQCSLIEEWNGELKKREQKWIDKLGSNEAKHGYNCQYPVKKGTPSKRMTAAHKKYWNSLSNEEKQWRVEHFSSVEFQQAATNGKQSKEHKKLKSDLAKAQWQLPKMQKSREALRERFISFQTNDEVRTKISQKAKDRWTDVNYRKRGLVQIGEASKKAAAILLADPIKHQERLDLLAAGRVKAALAIKAKWKDPEFRAKRIAQLKLPRKRKKSRIREKILIQLGPEFD